MAEKTTRQALVVATLEGVALELARIIAEEEGVEKNREYWLALYQACATVVYRARQESMPEDT